MTDIASLGLSLDSRPIVEGTKALDAFGESATRVDQKVAGSNGKMADSAKILQAQAAQANASAQANAALGRVTDQLTLGQQQLIERFREQAATIGMSRSQLMAYQAAQLGVTEQTREAIAAVKAHEDAMKAIAKAKEDAARSSNQLTDALKLLATGYAALKIGEYAKDSALMAARYETLGVVLEVVGKTAGYTKTQMDAAADGIARQGITMLESRNSAVKLVQAHVDLSHASSLARIAQDAAVIGYTNSSDAFDRLVNGISRGNVLILRNIGINVNLQAAYEQMADSLGKLPKELTENERVQARLNAVVERGADIAGTYEAAMGTAGKQILSMQRYVDDLKVKFGETFNEVLTVAVMGLTSGLKDANGEVSELAKNGQLAEWGRDLAGVMVGVANAVDNILTSAKMAGTWAAHFSASGNIDKQYGDKYRTASTDAERLRVRGEWGKALADEQAMYEASQVALAGQADRFQRAFDERTAAQLEKHKKDAAAKLAVDADYIARSQALLVANAGKSLAEQQAAQRALAKEVYQGTPNYRDTEGRAPKDHIDQAEATRLQNHLARIEEASAADKSYAEFAMKLDEMRHKAGELGDEQYFKGRKESLGAIYISEQDMYDKELKALRAHHNSTKEEREKNQKAIADVLGKQGAARQKYEQEGLLMDEAERLRQSAVIKSGTDAMNKYIGSLEQEAQKIEEANRGHEISRGAVERETVARLDLAIAYQKQFMAEQIVNGATEAELAQAPEILKYLEDQRALRERIAQGLDQADIDKASKKAADEASRDWRRAAKTIEDDLTNAILDGGGRGWKKLVRDMEYAFARMVLHPILQPIGSTIASIAYPGAPQSALGGVGGTVNAAGNVYSMISGGMTLAGGLGTGFMGSMAGGLMGAGAGSGLTSAAGLAAGESIAGVVGTGAAAAMGSGMAAIAAAAPYVAAIIAAVAIVKSLDHSGTPHIGGAASASSAGVSTIRAEDLHFEKTQTSADAEKMTAALASGIVGILDSTALAFGKTAGYTAATAFADDSSKDGAWGGLVISKLGEKLVDWQDARGNGPWAPKVFADGAEGQKQYLAAISADVRTALNGIGLPDWAQKMLDGLGNAPAIEDLAKVVDSINATQTALKAMGDHLVGFSNLTESAVSALMAAAGGIQNLATGASAYYDNFYSDAEKNANGIKQISDAITAVGLAVPDSIESFRALVESQMALGEAGAPAVATLFKYAQAFAQLHPLSEQASVDLQKQTDILRERQGLQDQLDQLTMTQTQLLEKQRNALDESNRALFDQVQAATEAKAAIEKAQASAAAAVQMQANISNGFVNMVNRMTEAAKALRDFNESLKIGDLSPLSKDAQYDLARKQFATAGPGNLQAASTAFLQASKARDGSALDYARDFAAVQQAVGQAAAGQDRDAATLASLMKEPWYRKMWGMDGSHANGLDYVPFDGYRAELHRGERVQTASEARSSDTTAAAVERLAATVERQQAALDRVVQNTKRLADGLEIVTDGYNKMRT